MTTKTAQTRETSLKTSGSSAATTKTTKSSAEKPTPPAKSPKPAKPSKPAKSPKKHPFAEGLSFKKLFSIFLIGSVFGTIYEDLLIYSQTYFATGTGVWMTHRGVIWGPFNVIYGFGAALMCWVLLRKKLENWQIFVYSAFIGGAVEYGLSFLQETFTGTTSWDYSNQIMNIAGRTTVPIMAFWGLLGLVLVKIIYPFLSHLIENIPREFGERLFVLLLVFMIFNMLISWTAILRQNLRHHGVKPFTPIGEFLDAKFNDDYLRRYFPNMVRTDGK